MTSQKTLVETACREFRCQYCNAEPGKPCVTLTSGFDRREVHAERFHEAFKAGRIRLRFDGCGYEVGGGS